MEVVRSNVGNKYYKQTFVNKVFVSHRTYLHVHFDIAIRCCLRGIPWSSSESQVSLFDMISPTVLCFAGNSPKNGEIICYLLRRAFRMFHCIVYDFMFLFEIKQISFPLWSRHFYTTKWKTLKTASIFYTQLKDFTINLYFYWTGN